MLTHTFNCAGCGAESTKDYRPSSTSLPVFCSRECQNKAARLEHSPAPIYGDTKTCKKCHEVKPISEFWTRGKRPKGGYYVRGNCKQCDSFYWSEYWKRQAETAHTRRAKVERKFCPFCRTEKGCCEFTANSKNRDGLQEFCKECTNALNRANYDRNRASYRTRARNRMQNLKIAVLNAYGGSICACCGETELKVLTVDHINNDGASHRKELKEQGSALYLWLIKNGFPAGFQVLCYNCNIGKHRNGGVCFHKTNPKPEAILGVRLPGPVGDYVLYVC